MIIEFITETKAKFVLDKDLMTWDSYVNNTHRHGKLYMWPVRIEVGKSVQIFSTDNTSGMGIAFPTTKVVEINQVKRDEPDILGYDAV